MIYTYQCAKCSYTWHGKVSMPGYCPKCNRGKIAAYDELEQVIVYNLDETPTKLKRRKKK